MADPIISAFSELSTTLDEEAASRETISELAKTLEAALRPAETELEMIHSMTKTTPLTWTAFTNLKAAMKTVESVFGNTPNMVRFRHSHFTGLFNRVATVSVVVQWVSNGTLHGLKSEPTEVLDIEEYLSGVCSATPIIARYAVNCVTRGDPNVAVHACAFVKELFSGFRLLNLRNDGLRRKYDAMKYDVKRLEEVVYDLKLRNLIPEPGQQE